MSRKQAVQLAGAVGYLALMEFLIYGLANRGVEMPDELGLVVLIGAQLAVGALVGWPALLLPPAVALSSVPAGYPPVTDASEPLPLWFGAMIGVIPGVLLVGLGVLGRWIYLRRLPE